MNTMTISFLTMDILDTKNNKGQGRRSLLGRASLAVLFAFMASAVSAQTHSLVADGNSSKTYSLIRNSVFSLEESKSNTPDAYLLHSNHQHIRQQYDSRLGKYVFAFDIHVNYTDNSRLITDGNKGELTDRQRNEIKTMDEKGASAKDGETMTFRWKFMLPSGMKTSTAFCHIHQLKGLGEGADVAHPVITLTCRTSGSSQELQLIHVADEGAANNYLAKKPLSNFLNKWIEATESYTVGKKGSYSIILKDISTGTTLLSYSSNSIKIWRDTDDQSCIRGKWGIYRSLGTDLSLLTSLRSETLLFADFETGDVNTAIPTVQQDSDADNAIFTLSGQRALSSYRGIVIKGGKKIIRK